MNNISYDEILINMHLSKLIYYYQTFNIEPYKTIKYYYENTNITSDFDGFKDSLEFLYNNYPNIRLYQFISNLDTDTQVGIFLDDSTNNIYITFRGTNSMIDVYNDIDIKQICIDDNNSVFVHEGFYKSFISVYQEILDTIMLLSKVKDLNFFATGHSLGSVQTTLFSYMISDNKIINNKIIKLVTFGSPRVGNLSFKNTFEQKSNIIHYRIINHKDIVTSIPYINYYHVGKQYQLIDNDIIFVDDNDCTNLYFRSCCYSNSFKDHSIQNYINNFNDKKNKWNKLNNCIY